MKIQSIRDYTLQNLEEVAKTFDCINWDDPHYYANWLAQTYYYVAHSTRVLAAAAGRFKVDRDNIHMQLIQHAKEEKSHEKLAMADLAAMKMRLENFPEYPSTKALYRSIYYLIEREHPISIFGYVYLLELLSLKRGPLLLECSARHGNKSSHTKYLKVHTEEDAEHIHAYAKSLEECSETEKGIIAEAVKSTADNYIWMMRQIGASKEIIKKKAA